MPKRGFFKKCKGRLLALPAVCFLLLFAGLPDCLAAQKEPVEVIMIHNNPCESCNEPEKLRTLLKESAPTQGAGSQYRGTVYYAYRGEGYELTERAAAYFGLEKKDIVYPLAIVGGRYLMGYDGIAKGLADCLIEADEAGLTKAMPGADETAAMAAQGTVRLGAQAGSGAVHLLYFYTEICDNCEKAEAYLETLPEEIEIEGALYPLSVTRLSVAQEDNALLFAALAGAYQVPEQKQQVPFLFAGDTWLSGEGQIRRQTGQLLERGVGLGYVYEADLSAARQEQSAQRQRPAAFLLKTAGVGFLNGFNPCALSLALLFISLIAALPKGFLRYGLCFIAGKFLAYTLLGLAACAALSAIPFDAFAWMRTILNLVLLILCAVLAVGNLLDCYHAAKGEYGRIRVQLPGRLRRFNDRLVKRIVNPKAGLVLFPLIFFGSMAVACGEFFCTGQIYLASILQWVKNGQGGVSVLAFGLYSAALCLPLLLILLMVKRGKSVFSLTGKSLKGMPVIKLCNAAIFLLFLILTIASWQ